MKWISVKDRLPEKDTTIIVAYMSRKRGRHYMRVDVGRYRKRFEHERKYIFYVNSFVADAKYWQPLPPPPDKEKSE